MEPRQCIPVHVQDNAAEPISSVSASRWAANVVL